MLSIGFLVVLILCISPSLGLELLAGQTKNRVIEIYQGNSFENAVLSLQPGDMLIVHEGVYLVSGKTQISVRGTQNSPISISGASGERLPLLKSALTSVATLPIDRASYVSISNLEITSTGGDGIRLTNDSSYVHLENLVIHDVDVGIHLQGTMQHISVKRNHVFNTGVSGQHGEAILAGCRDRDNECTVSESIIEENWIHATKAGDGDGIRIRPNCHSNIIRDNTIYEVNNSCISLHGTQGKGRNLVEGNVVWDCGEAGIRAVSDVVVRNNIIFSDPGIGFDSSETEEISPSNVDFIHNTILGGAPGVKLSGWGHSVGLVLANNAVYCEKDPVRVSDLDGATITGNVFCPRPSRLPENSYVLGQSPLLDFLDLSERNLYPTMDSPLIAAGDPLFSTGRDFNGTDRGGTPDVGAYAWTGVKNPGWKIVEGFKISKTR